MGSASETMRPSLPRAWHAGVPSGPLHPKTPSVPAYGRAFFGRKTMHLDHKAVGDLIRQIEADAIAAIAADPMDAECISAAARDQLDGVIRMLGLCRPTGLLPTAVHDRIARATDAQTEIQSAAERAQRGAAPSTRLPRHRAGILA